LNRANGFDRNKLSRFIDKIVIVRICDGHLIVSAVMEALYIDPDESAEGIRRYSEFKRGSSAGQNVSPETSIQTSIRNESSYGGDPFRAEKLAHNIAKRLQDKDKFSRSNGAVPRLDDFRNKYIDACEDYSLPPSDLLSFTNHILKDESYRFFQSQIKGKSNSYGVDFNMLSKNSAILRGSTKLRHETKAMLDGMRISILMREVMPRVKALAEASDCWVIEFAVPTRFRWRCSQSVDASADRTIPTLGRECIGRQHGTTDVISLHP
jgi:hypothetical protein